MTQALRLVFDDCISKHAAKKLGELASFSRGLVEIAHLATLNLEGQLDDDWIPVIGASGHVAVSSDRGKNPSKGGKFPILCQRHGVIHIMLSTGVHKLNQFDKIRAVLSVWPKIIRASRGDAGCGYSLRMHNEHAFDLMAVAPRIDNEGKLVQLKIPAVYAPPEEKPAQ